jgi:prepilin-type processing-associated H-X9-DG protein
MLSRRPSPRGFTACDLVVTLVLAVVVALLLLVTMTRGREQARLAACQNNLGQIGLALVSYNQSQRILPLIGRAGAIDQPGPDATPGPLRVLLDTLGLDSFQGLAPSSGLPPPAGPVPGEIPVPGFICASDPNAIALLFRAPNSYRATTGDDSLGQTGAFAPGRPISLEQIEQGDGTSFTAGFSERLVGNNRSGHMGPCNYASVKGPLPESGCTRIWLREQNARWYGDAGSSWSVADYRSTLYNHALPPGAPCSCTAADGQSALMGASSGHARGVNLLMLDGSVKLIAPSINPVIWKEFAALPDPGARPSGP